MKIRPVIGITGNERPFPDDPDANMSYAATGFVEAVKEAGGIPLILPIGDADMAKHYLSMIDKLIITGGQNVLPKFYGEEITIDSDDYLLKRDLFELALIEEGVRLKKLSLQSVVGPNSTMLHWVERCIKILRIIGRTIQVSTPVKSW